MPLCSQVGHRFWFCCFVLGELECLWNKRDAELWAGFGSAYQVPAGLQSLSHRERSTAYPSGLR